MLHPIFRPDARSKERVKEIDKKIREGLIRGTMSNYERCKLEEAKLIGCMMNPFFWTRVGNPY